MCSDSTRTLRDQLHDHVRVIEMLDGSIDTIYAIAKAMVHAIASGGKILWCGNGGSAADSQHLSAELVGRFRRKRRAVPSLALTTDTSVITAVANDFSYDDVFSRQIQALCRPGDVVVGISTSGSSPSVVGAIREAKTIRAVTVALTGRGGGEMNGTADFHLRVPSDETARIQEAHILVGHMLCECIERELPEQWEC
jgi:D-sedoheptulose 7-phosphate isomerase